MSFQPPPLTANAEFDRWMRLFYLKAIKGGLTDHAELSNLNSQFYSHLTGAQNAALTSGGDTDLHFHSSDRNRANHTGTQSASTISDFAIAVLGVTGQPSSNAWLEAQVYGR
jgi:hypothetical protein